MTMGPFKSNTSGDLPRLTIFVFKCFDILMLLIVGSEYLLASFFKLLNSETAKTVLISRID